MAVVQKRFVETLQKRLNARHSQGKGARVTVLRRIGSTKEVDLQCEVHGVWRDVGPRVLGNMNWTCPKCAKASVREDGRDRGYSNFVTAWKGRRNKNLRLLPGQEYEDTSTVFKARCILHDTVVSFTPNNAKKKFANALLCKECQDMGRLETRQSHGHSWTRKSVNAELARVGSNLVCLQFLGAAKDNLFQCRLCDYKWHSSGLNCVYKGSGCPRCVGNVVLEKDFLRMCTEAHGDRFSYKGYKGLGESVEVTCLEHRQTFTVSARSHLNSPTGRCSKCFTGDSRIQRKLAAYLESKGLRVETNVRIGDQLDRKEVDIYLPEHRIAIEVNGAYWHSEKFNVHAGYHLEKTRRLHSLGIQLLHFWDFEIRNRPSVIGSMLRNAAGLAARTIGARKCVVQGVSTKGAREFLEANHLGGFVPAQLYLGLWHAQELVALMSFGRPRFNHEAEVELLRFAVKKGTSVPGAFSRLFKHSKDELGFSTCVSYADRRYSTGKVYATNGFKLAGVSSPSYFYVRGSQRVSRYRAQKHRLAELLGPLFNPDISESENMDRAGYDRVWDCGQQVWIHTLVNLDNRKSAFGTATSDHLITYG